VRVEGGRRLSVHDGLSDAGGGWCKCEWVGRQSGLCGISLSRDTSMHDI
jgi:hypothetical protein